MDISSQSGDFHPRRSNLDIRTAFTKKLMAMLTTSVSVLGMSVMMAPAAHASGYGCAGTQIDSYSVKTVTSPTGVTYGTMYLYYDSSTGDNCAVTVSNSTGGYGVSKRMTAFIAVCSETVASSTCTATSSVEDTNNYLYYAGPVKIHAAGHCIRPEGIIDYNGNGAYDNPTGGQHCG